MRSSIPYTRGRACLPILHTSRQVEIPLDYTYAVFPPTAVSGEAMKFVRGASILLLFFLSLGALAGAVPMLIDPTGTRFGFMPLSLLRYTPFHSFLVPGVLLLCAIGLLPIYVLKQLRSRNPRHGLWVTLQGCVLLGFMISECLLLRMVIWLHYFYAAIGLVLIACGLILHRETATSTAGTQPETRSA